MTIKCFVCLRLEYYAELKWSRVCDAVAILDGRGYCYKHYQTEMGWSEHSHEKGESKE